MKKTRQKIRKKSKPTEAKNLRARLRESEAFEMRLSGATYSMIGSCLGITKQAAHKRVKEALLELNTLTGEDAQDVRRLEIERLDAMLGGLWGRARRGDDTAVDRVVRLMQRRADLLGLDAPAVGKLEHGGFVSVVQVTDKTMDDFKSRLVGIQTPQLPK